MAVKSLQAMTPEEKLSIKVKMDAASLSGVWLQFPKQSTGGHGKTAAGMIYLALLQAERRRHGKIPHKETARDMRRRLLDEVVKRLTQREDDDIFVLLAV